MCILSPCERSVPQRKINSAEVPCPGFLRPDPAVSVGFLFLLDSRGPSWHSDFLSDTSRAEHTLGVMVAVCDPDLLCSRR
ncbi:hypothetical protein IRJ41_013077 [Triplophysa rosa]|uniref:Uncharacterized protein n=1 Tax=Triplophysa rosa TaxID=992332 RepID=A0A9W8CCF0_TRIRA|nr:hypothetical protein IRJ41_013077 [Triplophysa rosa]